MSHDEGLNEPSSWCDIVLLLSVIHLTGTEIVLLEETVKREEKRERVKRERVKRERVKREREERETGTEREM
jgi:hypothetical protein